MACVACQITAPAGGGFLAPLTSYTEAACAASPSCPSTYYLNHTASACQSCVARQSAVCASGTFLHGQGCLGSSAPFDLTHPSADCRACSVDPSTLAEGTYLLTTAGGGCQPQDCPTIPLGSYPDPARPCAGSSSGAYLTCPAGCPPGTYNTDRNVVCNTAHFFSCARCDYDAPPGYWYTTAAGTNCSADQNVRPSQCPPGSYCVGGPAPPTLCPSGLTSTPGASVSEACFCRVGYAKQRSTSGVPVCVAVVCADTSALASPGVCSFPKSPLWLAPWLLYSELMPPLNRSRLVVSVLPGAGPRHPHHQLHPLRRWARARHHGGGRVLRLPRRGLRRAVTQ